MQEHRFAHIFWHLSASQEVCFRKGPFLDTHFVQVKSAQLWGSDGRFRSARLQWIYTDRSRKTVASWHKKSDSESWFDSVLGRNKPLLRQCHRKSRSLLVCSLPSSFPLWVVMPLSTVRAVFLSCFSRWQSRVLILSFKIEISWKCVDFWRGHFCVLELWSESVALFDFGVAMTWKDRKAMSSVEEKSIPPSLCWHLPNQLFWDGECNYVEKLTKEN